MGRGGRPAAGRLVSIPLHVAPVKAGSIPRPSGPLPPGVGTKTFQAGEENIPWLSGDSLSEGLYNLLELQSQFKNNFCPSGVDLRDEGKVNDIKLWNVLEKCIEGRKVTGSGTN